MPGYSRPVDLFEYQGKELLGSYGVPVSAGLLARSPEEAAAAASELGEPVVLKAQVLSGGRGKAGGIRLAADSSSARREAEEIFGLVIGGHRVELLWIEPAFAIEHEYYLSVTFDRGARQTLLMFTTEGGVEIEQVAAERPDALRRVHVDPLEGLSAHHSRALLGSIADVSRRRAIAAVVESLFRCYAGSEATLCEINPLVTGPDGALRALDAKVTLDDAALWAPPRAGRPAVAGRHRHA